MLVEEDLLLFNRQTWQTPKPEVIPLVRRYHSEIIQSFDEKVGKTYDTLNCMHELIGQYPQTFKIFSSKHSENSFKNHYNQATINHNRLESLDIKNKQNLLIDSINNRKSVEKNVKKDKKSKKRVRKSSRKGHRKTSVKRLKASHKYAHTNQTEFKTMELFDGAEQSKLEVKSTHMVVCPPIHPKKTNKQKNICAVSPYLQKPSAYLPCAVTAKQPSSSHQPQTIHLSKSSNTNLPRVIKTAPQNESSKDTSYEFNSEKSIDSPKTTSHHYDRIKNQTNPTKTNKGRDKTKRSLDADIIDRSMKTNSLRDRLSLIHCYGNDYLSVTQQYEMKRKKEAAMKEYKTKIAEKQEADKKKQLQRKKIYALNRLMTKLEQEKFKKFMETLNNNQ